MKPIIYGVEDPKYPKNNMWLTNILEKDKGVVELAHLANSIAKGTNFVLLVRDKFGSVGVYPRINQPCMGEFRKYFDKNGRDYNAVAHGDLAKSKKTKPRDLFNPFPSGEPVAFGRRHVFSPGLTDFALLDFLFSDKSPWLKGFASPEAVEFGKKDFRDIQYLVKTSDIDPSVWIQLTWTISNLPYNIATFKAWKEKGASDLEACLYATQNGDGYKCPVTVSLRRFFEGDPRELSGGTLREGGDYARSSHPEVPNGAEGIWMPEGAEPFVKAPINLTLEQLRERLEIEGVKDATRNV